MAGNQSSGKEVTVTEEYESQKWYHSTFGQLIGIGILASGLSLVAWYGVGHDLLQEGEKTKQAAIQVESQRLRTVEEMTRQYGSELSPEELTDLLEENNLNQFYLP